MTHGNLIYVMGPSGSGKDSVMDYARGCGAHTGAVFAHRYITRPAGAGGENHIHLTDDEFVARLEQGLFALNWDSHGLRYGVGMEIDQWMAAGLNVVVNGSRGYLPEASRRYPNLFPVLIEVAPAILEKRLLARGRESREEVARRLDRARAFTVNHPRLMRVDNNGPLSAAGGRLLSVVLWQEEESRAV